MNNDMKLKRLACEWVLSEHPFLYEREPVTDSAWANWFDGILSGEISEHAQGRDGNYLYRLTEYYQHWAMDFALSEVHRILEYAQKELG